MKIDTTKTGLEMIFPDYGARIIYILINSKGELTNREAHEQVNDFFVSQDKTISRATIINFMNKSVDHGFLTERKVTCKGGWKSIYKAAVNRIGLWEIVLDLIAQNIKDDSDPGIFDHYHSTAE